MPSDRSAIEKYRPELLLLHNSIGGKVSFNMIGLHYCYFLATCIHFVKLANAFPPSLDKKDILEAAAHPHSGSSDTIVGSENQYLKVST